MSLLTKTFVRNYDLNTNAYIYLATSDPVRGHYRIKTSGSSTTVTAVGSDDRPFAGLQAGDEIIVDLAGTQTRRLLTAVDPNLRSVTVNTAVNLENSGNGYPFSFRTIRGGTADTDGWHNVKGWVNKVAKVELLTLVSTGGLDYSIEGRLTGDGSTKPTQLATGNIASTTFPACCAMVPVLEAVSDIRIGLKWGTADGGVDSVSAYIAGEEKW